MGDDHAEGVSSAIDGDPRRATPRLDALRPAGGAVRPGLLQLLRSAPRAASRSLPGGLPHAVGVTRLTTRLPDEAVTLGDWLGDLGYDTAALGKMHFNGPSKHGFATPARLARLGRLAPRRTCPRAGRPSPPLAAVPGPGERLAQRRRPSRSACRPRSMESSYLVDRSAEFLAQSPGQGPVPTRSRWSSGSPSRTRRSSSPTSGRDASSADQFAAPVVSDGGPGRPAPGVRRPDSRRN